MKQYKVPLLAASFIANMLLSYITIGPAAVGIGIVALVALILTLLMLQLSAEDKLNSFLATNLLALVVLSISFVLQYLAVTILIVGIGGIIWYIFKKPKTDLTLFK